MFDDVNVSWKVLMKKLMRRNDSSAPVCESKYGSLSVATLHVEPVKTQHSSTFLSQSVMKLYLVLASPPHLQMFLHLIFKKQGTYMFSLFKEI